MRNHHVAIVGGGFSGVALAVQLLRRGDARLRITLIESGARLGRGIAYGTPVDAHLLNTPAGEMSLFEDDPGDFLRWLEHAGRPTTADAFVSRRLFGDYVEDRLIEALMHTSQNRPQFAAYGQTRVCDIVERAAGFEVVVDDGQRIDCDTVVLATGHAMPDDPLVDKLPASAKRYLRNPWDFTQLALVGPTDRVLLLGTGLTMIDVALALNRYSHRGTIHALSRRGLLPRPHIAANEALPRLLHKQLCAALARGGLRQVIRAIRHTMRLAGEQGLSWHPVVDALRPVTPDLWSRLSVNERQRFLRWIRPFWEVSRHRVAPQPAAAIDAMQACGRLSVRKGRVTDAVQAADTISVAQALKGDVQPVRENYDWVINCTGPSFARRGARTLENHLVDRGLLLKDPLGLGYVSAPDGEVFGRAGPIEGLYLLGPACRPHWWEHTAAPELRQQAARLAVRLLDVREDKAFRVMPFGRRAGANELTA